MSFVFSRLAQCKQMLSNSASVYSSIDDRESYRLRHVFDAMFGFENFVAEIVWQKRYAPDVRTAISDAHEYILVYAMSLAAFKEQRNKLPLTDAQTSQFKNPDNDERGPWKADNFTAPGYRPNQMYKITLPSGRVVEPPEGRCWGVIEPNYKELLKNEMMYFGSDGNGAPAVKRFLKDMDGMVPWTWWAHQDVGHSQDGLKRLMRLFGREESFLTAKPPRLISRIFEISTSKSDIVLDFFAGSGTTGEAVVSLNSQDKGSRSFILVEAGAHFTRVLLPRISKALYSTEWNNGKAQRHNQDNLGVVKYFAVESYEDALNNLPSPEGKLFEAMDPSTRDSLITYSLDLELGPHLLNMDAFKDPWGYKIYAQLAGEDEVSLHNVDMVETFNYLIGLKVQAYGPIERYNAEFVRLPHGDDKDAKGNPLPDDKREGRLRVEGRLRRDAEGAYLYQRVEGELNDGNATRVLVIWRKLTDDAEKDAAVLETWMARHRESTKERSDYREYHLIYMNGPITLPQPTQELRTVLPTEQTFKDRMFEDSEVQ
jgi:adenine-specific DNA-methyltransferase